MDRTARAAWPAPTIRAPAPTATTRQGSNVYGSWGSTAVQRGDDWAKTNRYTNNRTGNTTRTIRTDEGGAVTSKGDNGGRVAVGDGGNVYAGKDGNVYRREDGTWQKHENGGWSDTDRQPERQADASVDRSGSSRHGGSGHGGSRHLRSARPRCGRAARGRPAHP